MTEPRLDGPAWDAHLETLRRSMALVLDREGHWWHDGEVFEHPRLIAYFNAGIDTHPTSGEPIVHLGPHWCYFRAEDTPFLVRRLAVVDGALVAHLNNGEQLPVPDTGFEVVGDHVYVQLDAARGRRARLDRPTQNRLWGLLDPHSDPPQVQVGGRRWPVQEAAPSAFS